MYARVFKEIFLVLQEYSYSFFLSTFVIFI